MGCGSRERVHRAAHHLCPGSDRRWLGPSSPRRCTESFRHSTGVSAAPGHTPDLSRRRGFETAKKASWRRNPLLSPLKLPPPQGGGSTPASGPLGVPGGRPRSESAGTQPDSSRDLKRFGGRNTAALARFWLRPGRPAPVDRCLEPRHRSLRGPTPPSRPSSVRLRPVAARPGSHTTWFSSRPHARYAVPDSLSPW